MSVVRRPRPTLRVIREDLTEGWEVPGICGRAPEDLSPLAELPHPLLRSISDHCAELDDVIEAGKGWIRSTPPEFRLREFRMSQYRAGIWVDDGGGARVLQVSNPLHEINPDKQPNKNLFEMQISITFDEELGGFEITANFIGDVHSPPGRSLKAHALLNIERHENPRVTVFKEFHEFLVEIGPWFRHLTDLEKLNARGQAVDTLPSQSSHFLHKPDIADGTVNGGAQRTLCGMFIVPLRTPDELPVCPKCEERHALLPE